MTTTFTASPRADPATEQDRSAAYHDARGLALELGRGRPAAPLDPTAHGVVFRPDEVGYRHIPSWLYLFKNGHWRTATRAEVLITNRRLLCRLPHGQLASLPWQGLVGLSIDLRHGHLVIDHGDGHPVCAAGASSTVLAVASIAFVYGVHALVTHPALHPLRTAGARIAIWPTADDAAPHPPHSPGTDRERP